MVFIQDMANPCLQAFANGHDSKCLIHITNFVEFRRVHMMRLSTTYHPAMVQALAEGMSEDGLHTLAHIIESSAEGGRPIRSNEDLQTAIKELYHEQSKD